MTIPRTALALLALLTIPPAAGVAQEARSCPGGGPPRATLGITSFVCHCSYERDEGGASRWEFDTEPRVRSIEASGPSDGVLEEGDFVVAIDGHLITTLAGGRRWSTLEPGEIARLKVRRGGATREVEIRVGSACQGEDAAARAPIGERAARPGLSRLLPSGWLGFGLSCDCSVDTRGGSPLWTFWDAPRIAGVAAGSPASRAGIRPGDVLLAVDGRPLTGAEGARAFSSIEPGQRLRLTLRRDGAERELELVAEERP